jgi:hypothetical protein
VLVMGTTMVGLCAPSASVGIAEQAAAKAESPVRQRTTCCCGTKDARCCGTACCVSQSPNPVPKTPPLRSGSDRHESRIIAIVGALNGGYANSEGSQSSFSSLQLGGMLALATLQSQHVRIQT